MTDPTQPRLEEIRRRLAGISPGEWQEPHLCSDTTTCNCAAVLCDGYFGAICTVHVSNGLLVSDGGNDDPPLEEAKANGRLIANAPQDLAWLLDRVAELEQQIVVHECEVSQLRHLVFNAGTMLLGKLPAKMRLPIKSETDGDLSATYYTDADEELVAMVMKFDTATGRNASVRNVDFLELVRLANIGADAKSHHDAATIKSYAADAMTVREAYRVIQGGHRDETLLLDSLDDLADRMAAAKVENSHDAGLREGELRGLRRAAEICDAVTDDGEYADSSECHDAILAEIAKGEKK